MYVKKTGSRRKLENGSMDDRCLISVIIPVYNAEQTVNRAVESVLLQMNGQVELILVDDGSKDGSGAICDEYSRNNPGVQVVHKVNGGLSTARNAGMNVATGEYIVFLDADDYLDINTCERLAAVIQANRPDCIVFGMKYINCAGEATSSSNKIPKGTLLNKAVLKDLILPPLLNLCKDDDHFILEFSCNKVYRREIIEQHSVWFDEGRRIWEDRPFVVHYLKHCENLYAMEECFYNYVDVAGSLSRQYNMAYFDIILANYHHYTKLFSDWYDFGTQYVKNYWCRAIENMIFRSLEQENLRNEIERNILNTLKKDVVIDWYAERSPEKPFDKKMSQLVTSGKPEKALSCYKKKAKQKRRQMHLARNINCIKQGLREITKWIFLKK